MFLEEMIRDFGLYERFKISEEKMRNFLMEVRNGYSKKNPYHNFRHAFDVSHAVYLYLTVGNAAGNSSIYFEFLLLRLTFKQHFPTEFLTHLEIFGLLMASICHDVEHPGLNNTYQANTNSTLALRYNDKSILENHHSAKTFMLLTVTHDRPLPSLFALVDFHSIQPETRVRDFRKPYRS